MNKLLGLKRTIENRSFFLEILTVDFHLERISDRTNIRYK